MGGYFANRWVAGADFMMGVVGVALVFFGGAAIARDVGGVLLSGCPVMLVVGYFDWRREGLAAAASRMSLDFDSHHADLSSFATQMQLFLAQAETPWRSGPRCDQFQEHFPDLVEPVNAWLAVARSQRNNRYFAPSPAWLQRQAQGKLGVQSVATGHMRGECACCRAIHAEFSRATRRYRLPTRPARPLPLPSRESAGTG